MTHASVFSGIGGPEVAATMLGWENLFHCEINPFGRKVLDYWYPNSKSYDDITKTDFSEWRGKVDVLTGGFPCQPFSYAGKRRGETDDRYLWPYMFKCIDQIKPTWIVAENVGGITTMVEQGEVSEMENQTSIFEEDNRVHRYRLEETFTLQRICTDIESHGYAVQPVLIPACAVGAPHRRDRVFIVARNVANTDCCNNECGKSRKDESKSEEERLSERNEVRKSIEPTDVRSTMQGLSSNSDRSRGCKMDEHIQSEVADGTKSFCDGREWNASDTDNERLERGNESKCGEERERMQVRRYFARYDNEGSEEICGSRWKDFPSVSPVHRGNDGIPISLDNLTISQGKWRTESLKAYGNAIVPQVMYEIFRAIELVTFL